MRSLWLSPLRVLIKSINELMDFAEQAIKTHWFVTFSIGYWVLLALTTSLWLPYFHLVAQFPFGYLIAIALLLVIPVGLFVKRASIKAQQSGRLSAKQKSINTRLSDQHYKYLVGYVHKQQVDVFHDVVLVSLNMYYNAMNKVEYSKDEHGISKTLFDLKFTQTVRLFERILNLPEFRVKSQINPKQCNAIFCFAFFRVFFHELAETISMHTDKVLRDKDLISHIPYQFVLHLGSQNWRLYEFHQICFGDLTGLHLNDDILSKLVELTETVKPSFIEDAESNDSEAKADRLDNAREQQDSAVSSQDDKQIELGIQAIKKEIRQHLKQLTEAEMNNLGIYFINDEDSFYVITTQYLTDLMPYLDESLDEGAYLSQLAQGKLIDSTEPFEICIDDVIERAFRLNYRPRIKGLDESVIEAEILE